MFNLLVFSFNQGFGSAFKLRIRIRNQAGKNDRQKLTLHPVPKNMKNLDFFPIFVGHFRTPGSGSAIWMRIRIQQLKLMRIRIRNPGLLINFGLTQLTAFPNKKASGSRGQRTPDTGIFLIIVPGPRRKNSDPRKTSWIRYLVQQSPVKGNIEASDVLVATQSLEQIKDTLLDALPVVLRGRSSGFASINAGLYYAIY